MPSKRFEPTIPARLRPRGRWDRQGVGNTGVNNVVAVLVVPLRVSNVLEALVITLELMLWWRHWGLTL
jgi:hypothetical protein